MRALAAAMPPEAHAVPLRRRRPLRLPDPERLLRAFLDAVADTLPRSPAAPLAAGGPASRRASRSTCPSSAPGPRRSPPAMTRACGSRCGSRSPRPGIADGGGDGRGRRRSGRRSRCTASPTRPWSPTPPTCGRAARRARPSARARGWTPCSRCAARPAPGRRSTPLLSRGRARRARLADEEVTELLGDGAPRARRAPGSQVHWPRSWPASSPPARWSARRTAGDGRRTAGSRLPSFLSADALLAFNWQFALGGQPLTREEMDRLAEAHRPVVRLRDQWVLVDPDGSRAARERQDRKVDARRRARRRPHRHRGGRRRAGSRSRPTGWLAALRDRLADPEGGAAPVAPARRRSPPPCATTSCAAWAGWPG